MNRAIQMTNSLSKKIISDTTENSLFRSSYLFSRSTSKINKAHFCARFYLPCPNGSHLPTPFTLTASLFSVQIFPVQRAHKPAVSGSIASIDLRETFAFFSTNQSEGGWLTFPSVAYRWILHESSIFERQRS